MASRLAAWAQARAAKAKSDAIDRHLKEDFKKDSVKLRKEPIVLILGTRGSGKSTVFRQMQITYRHHLTEEELMTYRTTIYQNTLDSAQTIVLAMCEVGLDYTDPNNYLNAARIRDYQINPSPSFEFSPDIAQAIHQLWQDPTVSQLVDHSSEFYLKDNAAYFFTNVLRIGAPNYLPTENDVMQAYQESTGSSKTTLALDSCQIHLFDVGRWRSREIKWIHYLQDITCIVFCTALSDYDQVLPGNENQNQLAESLALFESVVNSQQFSRTSVVLLLTKMDLFKKKLPKVPLERYFPEYSGGADVNKAAKYILWRFMQTNHARLSVYPHLAEATDVVTVRLISTAVKETILNNTLRGSGIL